MKVLTLVTVLSLAGAGRALKCYSCQSLNLKDAGLPNDLLSMLQGLGSSIPNCDEFDPAKPMKKFEQECPAFHNGCMKISDPNNPKNSARACFVVAEDQCEGPICTCTTELCNSSGHAWPSVAALMTGLAAVLLGRQ